ncbi:MerR family transcriptional regulator [Isoptericola aurantiacus]|uniref:MerR family transcriptional regulator n=1 Tax=Isoptericola aurantiacus TaxID=3377839 RepID=UPI003839FA42
MFRYRAITATAPLTYRQLDHWCRQGILHPVRLQGSGTDRIFFGAEVHRARDIARLVAAGCSPTLAARMVDDGEVPVSGSRALALLVTS